MQRDMAYLLDIMESAKLALDYVKRKNRNASNITKKRGGGES